MRRHLILALVIVMGLGALAACGKKAAPRLPEGETLKVNPGKKGRHSIGVTEPNAPGEQGTKAPTPEETPGVDNAPSSEPPPESGF